MTTIERNIFGTFLMCVSGSYSSVDFCSPPFFVDILCSYNVRTVQQVESKREKMPMVVPAVDLFLVVRYLQN